jgi:HlyD family secretion protein
MNKKTWWIVGAAGLGAVALLAWAFAPSPVAVEVAAVTRAAFETSVEEDGQTRLQERYTVSAPLAGRLARITLREGDVVSEGQVLATFSPATAALLDERSAREQASRVQTAQAQVQLTAARVAGAQAALAQANSALQRTQQLATQGFVAPSKVDTDRLLQQAAQSDQAAAIAARHVAELDLQTAQVALTLSRSPNPGSTAFGVRSPVAGRVMKLLQSSEGVVALGSGLLELGDTQRLEVVADLLTTDALQTPPGAPVRIERWGGPGVLTGQVRRVEPGAVTKVSALGVEEQRVKLHITLTSPPAAWQALGDGFRVSVRIVMQQVADAVQVPVSAVFPLPAAPGAAAGVEPQMAVFVLAGGKARQVPITLGARNGSMAWVRSGLKPDQQVIVYPGAAVADGVKVKVRAV